MTQHEIDRGQAVRNAVELVELTLVEAERERRHGRMELVLHDGLVDYVRLERVVKVRGRREAA